MKKYGYNLALTHPFHTGKGLLHSRQLEIWQMGPAMVEYAPLPKLHCSLERYQKYLRSELAFWQNAQWQAKDIRFNGLIESGEEDVSRWEGFNVIKLKCGRRPLDDDIDYFHFLAAQWPQTRFRIDANRLWSLAQFRRFAGAVDLLRIEYFEEPIAQAWKIADAYPIAFDETVIAWGRERKYLAQAAAIVLKPHLYQNIAEVLDIIKWGGQQGMAIVLSSLFNSSVGTQNLLRLACLVEQETAHGLAPFFRLQTDTVNNPLVAEGDCFKCQQILKLLELR